MKNDKRLNIASVISITRKMCDYVEGIQHEFLTVGVQLVDNGELKDYLTIIVCPVDEISSALNTIQSMNGMEKEKFSVPEDYCHITTFENNMHSRSLISFDLEDDFPVKADFSSEYQYVEVFFNRYFQYRNQLVDSDVDAYFDSLVGEMMSSNHTKNRIQK